MIMCYKIYTSCKYVKISISIYVGNIIFECLFTYDLCIITKFGKGNPILNPLDNNTFLFISVWSTWLEDLRSIPNAFISFSPLFLTLFFVHWDREDVGSDPHNLISFFSFLLILSFLDERVWDRTPTTSFLFVLLF